MSYKLVMLHYTPLHVIQTGEAEPGVLFVSCEANNDLVELSVCTLNSSVSSFTFACEVF